MDADAAEAVVNAALESGITFFDTADAYGDGASEELLARALGPRRASAIVATKLGWGGGPGDGVAWGTRERIRASVAASLERLRTDYVDVLYYHRPDGITPLAETVEALRELVREGRVRALGISNVRREQLAEVADAFDVVQNEYSVLRPGVNADVLEHCRDREIGFVPFRPLAQGVLTGKYERGAPAPPGTRGSERPELTTDTTFERVERLRAFAEERGRSLLELALGGLIATPGVTSVVAGAMTPEQVHANAAAARWRPDDADLTAVNTL